MSGRLVHNAVWLIGDSVALKFVGLLVTAFVAARLGPAEFGYLYYVLSTATLFAVVGHLGLHGLIQRELVEQPENQAGILGTVLGLKMGATMLGAMALLGFGVLNPNHVSVERQLFAIMALAVVLQGPSGVLFTWFHARTRSRYAVLAHQIGNLSAAAAKVLVVIAGAGLLAVGLAHAAGITLTALAIWLFFLRDGGLPVTQWRFSATHAKALLSESWMIFLGTIFATIYLKIDLVMLRDMAGATETGVYGLAAMVSEASWFISAAIVTTLFPRLVRLNRENKAAFDQHLQELYDILAVAGLVILAVIWLLGPLLLQLFFGEPFAATIPILLVHALSLPFIFMRQGFSRWILISHMARFSMFTQGAGAALNVGLNLVLIPRMGGMGAAIATVISYVGASYLSLLFLPKTRPGFFAMTRALLQPWRAISTVVALLRSSRKG